MRTFPTPSAARTFNFGSADNSAVTVTLAADTEAHHALDLAKVSFNGNHGSTLAVTIGGSTVVNIHLNSTATEHDFRFPGLATSMNEAMVVTLSASDTGGVVGRLNTTTRTMSTEPYRQVRMKTSYHAPSTNTDAVNTIVAVSGVTHVVRAIYWSYDTAPSATANLAVTIGGVEKFSLDIPNGGSITLPIYFDGGGSPEGGGVAGLHGSANEEVVVTLGAAGANKLGKLTTLYA